jgi:ACS family tartrate transporter-like MFS transporter
MGGFLGPYIMGVLRQQTGGYAAGLIALATGLCVSAGILLVMGWRTKLRTAGVPSLP